MFNFNKNIKLEIEELKKCIEDHDESLTELLGSIEKIETKILDIEKKVDDLLSAMIQLTIAKSANKPERPTFKSANETEIKEAKSRINCTVKDISDVIGGLKSTI